jgi:HK97 family phage portal protein
VSWIRKTRETLAGVIAPSETRAVGKLTRSHPAQSDDAIWIRAPRPDQRQYAVNYVLNVWVRTAIDRIASAAASASLQIHRRKDMTQRLEHHGLLQLLGAYGKPNDTQSTHEFMYQHVSDMLMFGESFWLWNARYGATPDEVWLLNPEQMEVVPSSSQTIDHFIFRGSAGTEVKLLPEQVTHFKRYNPHNRYRGLSAMSAIEREIYSDLHMVDWNNQFFGDDVGVPAGIFVVKSGSGDLQRISDELNARYGERRRTAVVEADAGSAVYLQSGLNPRDADFERGRMINRRAIYEMLGLPLGLMSEASTEAHARVAERQLYATVDRILLATAQKLTVDALPLWNNWSTLACRFEDKRRDVADWEQLAKKVDSMRGMFTINEVRAMVFDEQPIEGGEAIFGTSLNNDDDNKEGDDGDKGRDAGEDSQVRDADGEAGSMGTRDSGQDR